MKFYLSLALAAVLMAGTATAQHVHVNIGIKGGLNLYNIHDDNSSQFDTRVGYHLGLLGHIHLNRQWAIQPEIVYSTEGARYTNQGMATKISQAYVNFPAMIQYMFDNGFRLEAGPQVGFLVRSRHETDDITTDMKEDLKTVDLALGAGAGYIWPSGFGVDARYNLGLSNFNENGSGRSTNRGFQLGVFYQFQHK